MSTPSLFSSSSSAVPQSLCSICSRSPSVYPSHRRQFVRRQRFDLGRDRNFLHGVPIDCEVAMIKNKGRGFGAVCYSAPLSPRNLQWISTVSSAILVLARGTAIQKSFLVPLFALQAPASVISWIKCDYGIWTAFLALLTGLFFYIPGELELPFKALLMVIVAPYQVMSLRGTQEGTILSLVIAGYLAYQHFSRGGSLSRAFDQSSIIATLAIVCVLAVPCLLLI